jgi:hypothetical protein
MSTQAIQKEISRVRSLKRASEAEVELLRSDMEDGKIHIRVNTSEDFRDRVAEAVVKESHPSWSWEFQGRYFADPVEGKVYFRESNALWNTWSDEAHWRIVPVDELVEQEGNDFDPSVDWQGSDLKEEIIWAWAEQAEVDSCNVTPDWDLAKEWAQFQPEWLEKVQEEEKNAWEETLSFAKGKILDEIIIELD